MILYEIALPKWNNAHQDIAPAHWAFQSTLEQRAGGYTQLPAAIGVWRDPDARKTYTDEMICYRVALADGIAGERLWQEILFEAFKLFPDQVAIFHAEIGKATITNREEIML